MIDDLKTSSGKLLELYSSNNGNRKLDVSTKCLFQGDGKHSCVVQLYIVDDHNYYKVIKCDFGPDHNHAIEGYSRIPKSGQNSTKSNKFVVLDYDLCINCNACVDICPENVIESSKAPYINDCESGCYQCYKVCPPEAIQKRE
jgi:NAD-dependent dihydropyrimidine dehydrogenase PreA subunit